MAADAWGNETLEFASRSEVRWDWLRHLIMLLSGGANARLVKAHFAAGAVRGSKYFAFARLSHGVRVGKKQAVMECL